MSDLYKFGYTLDETIKTMRDVIDTGNRDRMFLDTYYWLKMLSEYREIGTVEECREAVEKQKAKEPIQYGDDDEPMLRCPSCDENVTDLMDYGFNFALIVEKGGTENEIPKRNVHR